jgi:hypothetical protein
MGAAFHRVEGAGADERNRTPLSRGHSSTDHERGRRAIQLKEHTHDYVNREVRAIGGHYMFTKEVKMHFNERDILYLVGHGVVDTSCCGLGGVAYALVCGFVVSWKNKKNYDGVPVSEVEPIRDTVLQSNIRRRIQNEEIVSQVIFGS